MTKRKAKAVRFTDLIVALKHVKLRPVGDAIALAMVSVAIEAMPMEEIDAITLSPSPKPKRRT